MLSGLGELAKRGAFGKRGKRLSAAKTRGTAARRLDKRRVFDDNDGAAARLVAGRTFVGAT